MTSSSPAPKLPIWIFFATDIVLLAAAVFIAKNAPHPLPELTSAAIVACIIAGAAAALIPLILYYERQKNETLDDRQRALEALARTVSSSAEQISIAASGLHEIAEIAQRNLKQAEQLPHKLQEKISEFQAQLANANENEREELEKELEELRAAETERLQTVADRITRTAGEFAKLETTTHQHLIAANDAVSKLSFGTASAIGKAQAAAEQALAQARQEASRTIGEATGNAVKSIEAAKATAAAEFAGQVTVNITRLNETAAEIGRLITALQSAAKAPTANAQPEIHPQPATTDSASSSPAVPEPSENKSKVDETIASAESDPHPKRARRPKREEPATTQPAPTQSESLSAPPEAFPVAEVHVEPAPVLPHQITEVAPIAPATTTPFTEVQSAPATENSPTEPPPVEPAPRVAAEPSKPRKRPKKAEDDQPGLSLELDEPKPNGEDTGDAPAGVIERVLSSDGATRLIVTAYIGIGNRLFIRGSGPGLSWDKGVPLQFVSIGKWRWETNDANSPVQFKLLKNDEQESSGLGALTIEPGHQHEVTANFS